LNEKTPQSNPNLVDTKEKQKKKILVYEFNETPSKREPSTAHKHGYSCDEDLAFQDKRSAG
jgi:hypothetical protein